MSELILLGVLALILIGPQQLPEVARTLGRFINDLKRSAEDLTADIKNQARVDLDLDLDVMKPLRDNKPSPPIPIMKDPRIKDPMEAATEVEKKDVELSPIKIEAPDQMTFNFNAEARNDPEKTDSEKKD